MHKTYWLVHFERVNFVVCEFYLNKTVVMKTISKLDIGCHYAPSSHKILMTHAQPFI